MKAFLSHTSSDKDLVGLVQKKLTQANAWYDAVDIENGESIPEKIPSSFESNRDQNMEFAKRLYGYPLGAKLAAYGVANFGYSYYLKQPPKIQSLKVSLAKQLISHAQLSPDCQEYLKIV